MGTKTPKHRGPSIGIRRIPAVGFLAVGLWQVGVGAAQAAEWRYCYAYDEASRRFAMSAPFQPADRMDRVERAWRDYLDKESAQSPRTGCPLGATREEIGLAMKAAAAFNRGEGNHVVTLDWPAGDPIAAR